MLKSKKRFISLLSIIAVCFIIMSAIIVPTGTVSAASTSYKTQTRTITVITKANWWIPGSESITLRQTQGECVKSNGKKSKQYGTWYVVAKATDGSHTTKATLSGKTVKVKLKPNKTYKVTVTWSDMIASGVQAYYGNYVKLPTWKVDSTWKVSNYY